MSDDKDLPEVPEVSLRSAYKTTPESFYESVVGSAAKISTGKTVLGFTYSDLVAARFVQLCNRQITSHPDMAGIDFPSPEGLALLIGDINADLFDNTLQHDDIVAANNYLELIADCFEPINQVERIAACILSGVPSFPESIDGFRERVTNGTERLAITVDEGDILVSAHTELFELWRLHNFHVDTMRVLSSMADAMGHLHDRDIGDSEWPCLYHRGMEINDNPMLQIIVDTYNRAKEVLGFSPALMTPGAFSGEFENIVAKVTPDNEFIVKIPTFIGMIWLEGAPEKTSLGSGKLSVVK